MDEAVNGSRVIVLGATGQIGIFAIPRLLAAGFEVVAVSRRAKPGWYPEFKRVQWARPEDVHPGAAGVGDMLLSAGPITIATRLVDQCPRLSRAVVFSTSSVFSKLESNDRGEKRHMQQLVMDEARLSSLCESREITLSLYRPTLVYGCGMDGNVSWLARWIRRFGFIPVAGRAEGLRQPVHADDLAQAAVATLASESPLALDVPLCGGSTLSFREMVARIFHALDRPERIVSLPGGLFRALARIGRLHPRLRNVRPEMIRRVSRDLVFDDTTPRTVLGYDPRPFAPGPADFELPDEARLRALAEAR
jgi:nucleoside-diphosphate-sugar epimerase